VVQNSTLCPGLVHIKIDLKIKLDIENIAKKKPTSHPTTRLQGRSQLEKYHEKTSQPQGRGFLDNADFNKFCFLGVFKDPLSSRGRLV